MSGASEVLRQESGATEVPRAGAWRQEVRGRAARIRESARVVVQSDPDTSKGPVEMHLQRAEQIAQARSGLAAWWSGSSIEEAWLNLRLAEEAAILQLPLDAASIRPAAERARQHARVYLPADHSGAKALDQSLNGQSPDWAFVRQAAHDVTAAAHELSDQRHQLMRSFRNQLLGLIGVLIGLGIAAGILVALLPAQSTAGLLPAPPGMSMGAAVVFAMAMGCVGALFSAIPSLAQTPTVEVVFNPIRVQAVLKVVVGAWSGVVGLMVVQAGMAGSAAAGTSQPAQAGTLAGFAVMAALFGSSQEALTRFADHRARATAASP